ncbi:MAG TPA: hypothetical protein VN452_03075 [Longilinea sp.]|nr:hypothetical protein [Longilinea sp.]
MTQNPSFDLQKAHHFFAANCFNQVWDLVDKTDRTPEEDEQMIRLALASHYHWTQRNDYSAQSESIACWQISRVYAVLAQADNARRYAEKSLDASRRDGSKPFYTGYSYEALARAESIAGNPAKMTEYLAEAHRCAQQTPVEDDRQALLNDLNSIHLP